MEFDHVGGEADVEICGRPNARHVARQPDHHPHCSAQNPCAAYDSELRGLGARRGSWLKRQKHRHGSAAQQR
jgi:hypothetical protein